MKGSWFKIGLYILLVSLLITPSYAGTLTGHLGTSPGWTTLSWTTSGSTFSGWSNTPRNLQFNDVQLAQGFISLIDWYTVGHVSLDVGAPSGATTTFTMYNSLYGNCTKGSTVLGTGTIGYQRLYTYGGSESGSYLWLILNDRMLNSDTGDVCYYIDYDNKNLYNFTFTTYGTAAGYQVPSGYAGWGATGGSLYAYAGSPYTMNKNLEFHNTYSVTKPSGLGITGYVAKNYTDGETYQSRVFVVNASDNAILASEYTVGGTQYNFTTNRESIYLAVLDSNLTWYNSSTLFSVGDGGNTTTPTPTPTGPGWTQTPTVTGTPIVAPDYTLTISSSYANVNQNITATVSSLLDADLSEIRTIQYSYVDESYPSGTVLYEYGSTAHTLDYGLISGTWYGYDTVDVDYNNNKGATIPNPVTVIVPTGGTKTLQCYITTSDGGTLLLSKTLVIAQDQNTISTKFQAVDGTNGGLLLLTQINVKNKMTGAWTNQTYMGSPVTVTAQPGAAFDIYGTRTGFEDAYMLGLPAQDDYVYTLRLFSAPAVGTGFVNYYVIVEETGGWNIGGALIEIKNTVTGNYTRGTSSSAGGSQIFNLTNSTLHTWTVSKSGYQSRSGSFTTPASGSGTLTVQMLKAPTPTRTTAPLPTGSWTVNPSFTPTGVGGNLTGFWAPWIRVFSMMGAGTAELPLLIAGLIIIICAVTGAGMAGILGAEVFMGFGAIFCVALGLIPIWVVLAIIILGFLAYGLKVVK